MRPVDLVGPALLVAGAGWAVVASSASGGDAWPVAATHLIAGAALVLARVVASRLPALVPAAIAAAAAGIVVRDPTGVLHGGPLSGPFGYSNATGALFVVAIGAVLALAASTTALGRAALPARAVLVAVAGGFVAVPWISGVKTAAALGIVLLAVFGCLMLGAAPRYVAATATAALPAAVATTAVLGVAVDPSGSGLLPRLVERTITSRRVELWHDAVALLMRNPLTGVGPGRFAVSSPVARSDPDAAWAHNAFLQQGAEGGVVALVLLALVFAWAFAALPLRTGSRRSALGAATVAAVGIHASVDYVLHRPAVPSSAAALVGGLAGWEAYAARRRREAPDRPGSYGGRTSTSPRNPHTVEHPRRPSAPRGENCA